LPDASEIGRVRLRVGPERLGMRHNYGERFLYPERIKVVYIQAYTTAGAMTERSTAVIGVIAVIVVFIRRIFSHRIAAI